MSASGEFATLAYLQTLIFLSVDAVDFGGAAGHDAELSSVKIEEQTAVMEELEECIASLLLPAFQHPTEQCPPPPSNDHLYPSELTCNSLCFIQHHEQHNSLILICMKCETAQHHPFNYLRALPDHHSPRMRENWSLLGACGGEICYTS